jgi:hypothetical protein
VRKLDGKKYIGLSVVVSGYYVAFKDGNEIFKIFEDAIEELVERGEFIHYGDDGKIVSSENDFIKNEEELHPVVKLLTESFSSVGVKRKLPPVNYSISKDSVKQFMVDESKSEIIDSSYKYGYTCIYKVSHQLTPYRWALPSLISLRAKIIKESNGKESKHGRVQATLRGMAGLTSQCPRILREYIIRREQVLLLEKEVGRQQPPNSSIVCSDTDEPARRTNLNLWSTTCIIRQG